MPFEIAAGETIHYIVIEWLDLSSQPVRFVRSEAGLAAAVESELVLPLDPANVTETRFRLDDVLFAEE